MVASSPGGLGFGEFQPPLDLSKLFPTTQHVEAHLARLRRTVLVRHEPQAAVERSPLLVRHGLFEFAGRNCDDREILADERDRSDPRPMITSIVFESHDCSVRHSVVMREYSGQETFRQKSARST